MHDALNPEATVGANSDFGVLNERRSFQLRLIQNP